MTLLVSLIIVFNFLQIVNRKECFIVLSSLYTAVSRKVVQLKSIKAYAKIPKGMMGCGCSLLFTSFQRVGRRCYEYLFARVKRNKMDSELLTRLLSISQTTFRHCRVRFYAFLDNLCRNSCM